MTLVPRYVIAVLLLWAASLATFAAPPAYEAIIKACDESENAAQCERLLEKGQLKQFHGVATRDGSVLRLPSRPGAPPVELRDSGDPESETGDFRWHAFWDFWPEARIAVISVSTRDTDHFLLIELERGAQTRVPAEPLLSPDSARFLVSDFCDKGCGNQIQVWRIERNRPLREKTFKPRERWYETDVSWRDATSLTAEYSIAGPRRRLAEPGEVNLVKAGPMVLKLSDAGWMSDEPRR